MGIITVRYFAWVRERIGRAEERIEVPAAITTAGELVAWLRDRGPEYAHALERPDVIRIAIDQAHAPATTPIAGVREIALFPPVTGG